MLSKISRATFAGLSALGMAISEASFANADISAIDREGHKPWAKFDVYGNRLILDTFTPANSAGTACIIARYIGRGLTAVSTDCFPAQLTTADAPYTLDLEFQVGEHGIWSSDDILGVFSFAAAGGKKCYLTIARNSPAVVTKAGGGVDLKCQ